MNLSANAGDVGDSSLNPGLGRSPGGVNGNLLYILAWKISWTEDRGSLLSMGSLRVSMHTHKSNTIIKQKKQEHFLTTLYMAGIVTDFKNAVQSLSCV